MYILEQTHAVSNAAWMMSDITNYWLAYVRSQLNLLSPYFLLQSLIPFKFQITHT